jgi:hypothetical protein
MLPCCQEPFGDIIILWRNGMPKKIVKQMADEYVRNEVSADTNDVIKQTIANVYTWASSGKSKLEIAKYLTLTKKEFDDLQAKYPEVLGAFIKGKEFANTLLSMSMYEMAMGNKTIKRQVVTKDGLTWLEEEIPANVRFNAMKFLLENQVPEVYGKNVAKQAENEYANVLASLTDAEKKALMIIEKRETINTLEFKKKESPVIDTQSGEITNENKD